VSNGARPDPLRGTWVVGIGDLTKAGLLARLRRESIALNVLAEELIGSDRFATAATRRLVEVVEVSAAALGLVRGGTTAEVRSRASRFGLGPCPIELAPYFRLQYRNQPEADPDTAAQPHQAPAGALTVVSEPLVQDDAFPKGFYLRRLDGILWLRGYRCDRAHVWAPQDCFALARLPAP
jgi:hypothetical protein